MPGTVSRIAYAVVKGLGLTEADRVEIGPEGIEADRRFHLADARGRMLNGKRCGALVQVGAAWDADADALTLTLPGGETVVGEVALGAVTSTRFYGRQRPGRAVDGPWAAALSDLAGEPVTLVRPDWGAGGHDRSGRGPVTLLADASIAALEAASGARLDPRRFRMTLGIAGVEAHAEEGWMDGRIPVADVVLVPTMAVARCLVTSQDPDSGRADHDVLGLLRDYRPEALGLPLPLGIATRVSRPGTVAVGDPIGPGSTS